MRNVNPIVILFVGFLVLAPPILLVSNGSDRRNCQARLAAWATANHCQLLRSQHMTMSTGAWPRFGRFGTRRRASRFFDIAVVDDQGHHWGGTAKVTRTWRRGIVDMVEVKWNGVPGQTPPWV